MNFAQFVIYIFQVFTGFHISVHWRVLITKSNKRDLEDGRVFQDEEELSFYDFVDRLAQQTGATSRVIQGAAMVKKYLYDRYRDHEDIRSSRFSFNESFFFDILKWYTHMFSQMEIVRIYDDDHHATHEYMEDLDDRWLHKPRLHWRVNEAVCEAHFAEEYDSDNEDEYYDENESDHEDESDYENESIYGDDYNYEDDFGREDDDSEPEDIPEDEPEDEPEEDEYDYYERMAMEDERERYEAREAGYDDDDESEDWSEDYDYY